MCFGDTTNPVEDAEGSLARIAESEEDRKKKAFDQVFPLLGERASGGLPFADSARDFAGGRSARAFAPRRAALFRRGAQAGLRPDDPSFLATIGDLEADRARQFDDSQLNIDFADDQAKMNAILALLQGGQAQDPTRTLGTLLSSLQA